MLPVKQASVETGCPEHCGASPIVIAPSNRQPFGRHLSTLCRRGIGGCLLHERSDHVTSLAQLTHSVEMYLIRLRPASSPSAVVYVIAGAPQDSHIGIGTAVGLLHQVLSASW